MDPSPWRALVATANLYKQQRLTAADPITARGLDVDVGLHSAHTLAYGLSLGLRSGRHPRPDRKDERKGSKRKNADLNVVNLQPDRTNDVLIKADIFTC
jgi:hypothetical protein